MSSEVTEKSLFGVTQTFIKNKLVHINDILAQRYDEFSEDDATSPTNAIQTARNARKACRY